MKKLQTSIEAVDIDKALAAFDGNRFHLILASSIRAREIASSRIIAERGNHPSKHEHHPVVTALQDFASGKAGKEYLDKLR